MHLPQELSNRSRFVGVGAAQARCSQFLLLSLGAPIQAEAGDFWRGAYGTLFWHAAVSEAGSVLAQAARVPETTVCAALHLGHVVDATFR